ncbi:MAG: hypothetical protein HZB53_16745 [Chloroflexi bacterium]|nr:hypothetical protein [Chloroflexota bacterium]
MTTCPFCGTTYPEYRSNCKSRGAPLPKPPDSPAVPAFPGIEIVAGQDVQMASELTQPARPEPPPPPPRPISSSYVVRIMVAEAWGIIGFVFALIGSIFTCVGLSTFSIRDPSTLIFAFIGLLFAVPGWGLLVWRLQHAGKVVEALRTGETAEGQITEVTQDYSTTINGEHPWIIRYHFNADGATQNGEVRTMTFAGYQYRAGMPAYVLYLRRQPEYNSLYPHP